MTYIPRRRRPKKHNRLAKVLILTLIILAGFIGFNLLGKQPEVPAVPAVSQKLDQVKDKGAPLAKSGAAAAATAKTGATTLMEKIHTVMYIDQAIAQKRQEAKWVPLAQIPKHTQNALIAIEDHDFYKHGALDISSIFRAMLVNAAAGEIVEGGSTLTQQLVKNMFLSDEQSLSRKAEEAVIAYQIERHYSKDEILELYFNTTYFGAGAYGIKEAAAAYFDKKTTELTPGESCVVAAMPYAPSALNPYENPIGCQKRMTLVLNSLEKYQLLTIPEANAVRANGVVLKDDSKLNFL
jgi:membrane peptidoglycan carboxypeptidase